MRPLEISLVVLIVLSAICVLVMRWRVAGRLLAVGCLLVAAAHAKLEGVHWQMIPAYAAVLLLCLIVCLPARKWRGVQIAAGVLTVLLAGGGVACSLILPIFSLPRPTGPYEVGTMTIYMKDSTRVEDAGPKPGGPRELMVQLWYPAQHSTKPLAIYRQWNETRFMNSYQSVVHSDSHQDAPVASAGAPFPVVLFNPGWKGRRTQNTFLTEELASQGYVVAAIDHTYNSGKVAFPDGRVIKEATASEINNMEGSTPVRVREVWDKELRKWAADQSFVLDQLAAMSGATGSPWSGKLNTNLTAAVGHSFGGAASTEVCALDPRVKGAVNMDGWFFGAIRVRGPNQPLLLMLATSEQQGGPDPTSPVVNALNVVEDADVTGSIHKFGGYVVEVKGVNHEDFSDQALLSPWARIVQRGTLPAWQIDDIERTFILAFVNKTLRGEDPWLLRADSTPSDVVKISVFKGSDDAAPPARESRKSMKH